MDIMNNKFDKHSSPRDDNRDSVIEYFTKSGFEIEHDGGGFVVFKKTFEDGKFATHRIDFETGICSWEMNKKGNNQNEDTN